MSKFGFFVLILTFIATETALANRFGDAWKGSKSRVHGRFTKQGDTGGGATTLLLLSSTTITSVSSTAMTSGGNMLKQVAVRDEFIDQNTYAIQVDSAKGQGEYLQTLATLSGCEGAEAQGQFASAMRSNFADVYKSNPSSDPTVIADHIDDVIESNSNLRGMCRDIRAETPTT